MGIPASDCCVTYSRTHQFFLAGFTELTTAPDLRLSGVFSYAEMTDSSLLLIIIDAAHLNSLLCCCAVSKHELGVSHKHLLNPYGS